MASPLARLKAFSNTRNGKIVLGGGGATGVVGVALLARKKNAAGAGADSGDTTPAATSPIPSYLQNTGTSGTNTGSAVDTVSNGIDPGQFNQLLEQQAETNDKFQEAVDALKSAADQKAVPYPTAPVFTSNPPPAAEPAPVVTQPAPAPAPAASRTYTVVSGDTLSGIAKRFYGNANRYPEIYNANRAVIGGNPNLIKPGQRLVIP